MADRNVKFFVSLSATRDNTGRITAVKLFRASTLRPTGDVPSGTLTIELELAVPDEMFNLKAKAKLTADRAIAIKSLRDIERELDHDEVF